MTFLLPQPRSRFYGTPGNYLSMARDALTGRLWSGDDAPRALEQEVAAFIGRREALCMPQARVGIYLGLKAAIRPGQTVILSPYTIHDVVNMVICAGGRPVFADIERETCNIDAAEVERLIDADTGAVLVTHLHGLACDIERIAALCRARKVVLMEDCAQAFGAAVNGRRVGSFGDIGVFSFGMAKNINSFYGGMLVTDDAGLAARIREEMRGWPVWERDRLWKRVGFCLFGDLITSTPLFWGGPYWVFRYGLLHNVARLNNQLKGEKNPQIKRHIPESYLRRMSPAQARLAKRQIRSVDAKFRTRLTYARAYHEGLKDVPGLIVPPLREDGSHVYLTFPIQVPDRQDLLRYLTERLRDLAIQHIVNAAEAECFREFHGDCPNARQTAQQVLLLPTYPSYGMRNVRRNIELVREYFALQQPAGAMALSPAE